MRNSIDRRISENKNYTFVRDTYRGKLHLCLPFHTKQRRTILNCKKKKKKRQSTHFNLHCVQWFQSCLFVTPWTIAHQPLSMRFSPQEYWSGLLCPSPGDPPDPCIKPASPALQVDSLPVSHWGGPLPWFTMHFLGKLLMATMPQTTALIQLCFVFHFSPQRCSIYCTIELISC